MELEELEKKIGFKFKSHRLLEEAMTHKSFVAESNGSSSLSDNERLEFLGDSVLNTAVTEFLFRRFPKEDEGRLSKFKSQLVARPSLVEWAKELKIGSYLRLSLSEERTGGRERDSLLANAMEALIGAIFLDQGFEKARDFVLKRFSKKKRIIEKDYKSKLQEIIQKKYKILPSYVVQKETGPDHAKVFSMEVRIRKKFLGQGEGKSKKEAEQSAARNALKNLEKSEEESE